MVLLIGPLLFFTPYWRPSLYLVGIGVGVYLGVIWVLSGMEFLYIGVLTGVVATGLILVAGYLFFRGATEPRDA